MSVRLRKWTDTKDRLLEAWVVDVKLQHPDGRIERIRKVSPVNTRRGAEQYERELRHALLTGTFRKEETQEKRIPTLEEFTPRFLTCSENNNKHSSVISKRQALEDHILPVFGEMALNAIGAAENEDFKALMRKKLSRARARKDAPTLKAIRRRTGAGPSHLSPKYINNVLAVLHKSLVVAQEQGVIAQAPRVKLLKTKKPSFDFLSFEEVERLIAESEPAWRTLLLVAIKTGLRQGELIGLQWSDLDLKRAKLHVRRAIWRGVTGLPKGGRERTVDLPLSVVEALKEHRHLRGSSVFCQDDGQPLTDGKMRMPLRRALKRADIAREQGHIGWHDLRHTYGSHLACGAFR